jgi:hypothetical protein
MPMLPWTGDELNRIGTSEEAQFTSLRLDSKLRKPVTIWVFRVGNDLYVRSVHERGSGWFRGTQVCHEGCFWAGGVEKDVTYVEETDPAIHDQIDAAYLTSTGATTVCCTMVTPM